MILTQLLKDEDNKYCVDCDAKGEFRIIIYKYWADAFNIPIILSFKRNYILYQSHYLF